MSATATIRRLIALRGRAGRVRTGVAVALVVVCGAVAAVEILPALAGPGEPTARPVPQEDLAPIVAAATSCPALTPARLAASLMAASGFDSTLVTSTGATGIAALSTDDWTKWRPWPDAGRRDDRANIFALAHRTCDVVGQLRAARFPGDPWQAATAAGSVGLPTVLKAHQIPPGAQQHIDIVSGYAEWYASQSQLSRLIATPATVTLDSSAQPTDALPVPDAYRADVLAAGRACAAISPAGIAAQLMAASRFNPNLASPDGLQGIAQFRPEAWIRYRPSATASPWNPHDAVPALGTAMCDLAGQLSGLNGGDPYILALAAFQWGNDTVRAAGGVPRVGGIRQLSDLAPRYVRHYSQDRQLDDGRTPPPSPSSTSPGPALPSAPSAAAAPTPKAATFRAPPPPPAPRPIVNPRSGKCLAAPQDVNAKPLARWPLVLWTCNGAVGQQWQPYPDGTMRAMGLCMDAQWNATEPFATVQIADCNGNPTQQFTLNPANQIVHESTCVDDFDFQTADGTRIILWPCTGAGNQNWSWR